MKNNSRTGATVLFTLRLFFYFTPAALVLFHPGISVSYDRAGLVQWFIIIPIAAIAAFFPAPRGKFSSKMIIAIILLAALSIWGGGFSASALPLFFAGMVSFVLTLLLFHYPRFGKISCLEPFLFAWVCFRLLVFSRSGEEAALGSAELTQFILIWTGAVFLFHSAVVYLCLFPKSASGLKREGLVFGGAAVFLGALVFFLPSDFIENAMIDNFLPDQIERRTRSSNNDWGIPDSEDGRRQGRRTLPRGNGRPGLRGLSEHDWPSGRRGGRGSGQGGQSLQYTVKVVASKNEPLYMGNEILGRLDPVEGFLLSLEEDLNGLSAQRLFVSWNDSSFTDDIGREQWEVFALSTLPQRYFPYRPLSIQPTIQSENSGPFRFIHQMVSNVHSGDPLNLIVQEIRELSDLEKRELEPYLELPLADADIDLFRSHLDLVMEKWQSNRSSILGNSAPQSDQMEKVAAILFGFSEYQYHINDNNHSSIADISDFLFNTMEGDCVEFSNSAALLGRLAGIPSRVVNGFLAAGSLQTVAHVRGLAALRSRIPVLQQFPLDDLYLVTDAHGHSWTQFYISGYGWLDFEATAFAIPPNSSGDGNLRDVVIPFFDENRVFSNVRAFPWRVLLKGSAWFLALALSAAYVLRYGREILLFLGCRQGGKAGARCLYLLLLARLASDGKPIKPISKTAPEYAALFPATETGGHFAAFASIYTEIRWRKFENKTEEENLFGDLKEEYKKILTANRRKGILAFTARIFSLRGLSYL